MKIRKPDEAEVRNEHRNLYKGHIEKDVARAAGRSSTLLCRQLSADEAITRNPVFDVIMEMIGSVESEQSSIGKGVFRMVYEYASALGLVDDEPVDILEMTTVRLHRMDRQSFKNMTEEEMTAFLGRIAVVENELKGLTDELCEAKKANGCRRRQFEPEPVNSLGAASRGK